MTEESGRRVSAFVFNSREGLMQFLTLEDAEREVGVKLQDELAGILDEKCTIFFVENDGSDLTPELKWTRSSGPKAGRRKL
jgi:hypothetical protein